jgi:hypothetical protein
VEPISAVGAAAAARSLEVIIIIVVVVVVIAVHVIKSALGIFYFPVLAFWPSFIHSFICFTFKEKGNTSDELKNIFASCSVYMN